MLSFDKDLLLPFPAVALLALDFYLSGMRRSVLLFRDTLELYWYDRNKALFESAINLTASFYLGIQFGVAGIFLGTTINSLTTCFWVELPVLYRYGLFAPLRGYFMRYGCYILAAAAALAVTVLLCGLLPGSGLGAFAGKMLICAVVHPGQHFAFCLDTKGGE